MAVDARGVATEIEYHIAPGEVPAAVQSAMRGLYTGADFTGAERETHSGKFYWELSVAVGGHDVEAMFLPDGMLHSQENEVAQDTVPHEVQKGAMGLYPDGAVTAWDEIRNGQRELTEFHVKMRSGGMNYKAAISLDGTVTSVVREVGGPTARAPRSPEPCNLRTRASCLRNLRTPSRNSTTRPRQTSGATTRNALLGAVLARRSTTFRS